MVHWPETMMTYDQRDGILFSMDAFGGFGSLDGGIFDDEVNLEFYEDEIRRYFSNIVGKYSGMVQKALKKLQGLDVRIVAPTHGPVWRENPKHIISLYDGWSRYEAEKGVVIVYGSMYGLSLIHILSPILWTSFLLVNDLLIYNIFNLRDLVTIYESEILLVLLCYRDMKMWSLLMRIVL